ncbi:Uncharacterised protein [Bordetella pertussis]|nr:Uncharacterised protein [Bordetella pertussis]CRE28319.1 Uncharacterised protein [Bordetella pertussis]
MFSRTVKLGTLRGSWKVRVMPAWATLWDGQPAMSWPLYRTRPEVGR